MTNYIYGRADGDLITKHNWKAVYAPIEKYGLPTEDQRALTSYQHFAVSTRLRNLGIFKWNDSKVMEHHEFVVAASCKKDDGQIIHAGTLGPFIRASGQSWWGMLSKDIPKKTHLM